MPSSLSLSQPLPRSDELTTVTVARRPKMVFPGLLCVGAPVALGLTFRAVGAYTERPLLGAQVREARERARV